VAVEEFDRGPGLDAALIACGQAIEHYGIARYGALVAWVK
jgi:ferritin-like metal-binding protein YciE